VPDAPAATEFYSTRKVAEMLEVTQDTVRVWIKTGRLYAIRIGARGEWRVPRSEFRRFAGERYPQ
jgi:excisionase family DNA binding protein